MANDIVQQHTQELTHHVTEQYEMSVTQVVAHLTKVREVMAKAMKPDHHYGIIPGTPKPTLLKPGAELLCMMFRLDPQYSAIPDHSCPPHVTYVSTCTLYHIPTAQRVASGMGSCSTREAKYAYRQGSRVCPKCKKETIIKGKAEYGGGWLCYGKKGGCGAKFQDGDQGVESQVIGRIENDDLASQENTVLKMANKRSLIAATLNATACSDIFTQDIEDMDAPQTQAIPAGVKRGSDLKPPQGRRAYTTPTQPVQADPGAMMEAQPEYDGEAALNETLEPGSKDIHEVLILVKDVKLNTRNKSWWDVIADDSKTYQTDNKKDATKLTSAKQNEKQIRIWYEALPNGQLVIERVGE